MIALLSGVGFSPGRSLPMGACKRYQNTTLHLNGELLESQVTVTGLPIGRPSSCQDAGEAKDGLTVASVFANRVKAHTPNASVSNVLRLPQTILRAVCPTQSSEEEVIASRIFTSWLGLKTPTTCSNRPPQDRLHPAGPYS